MLIALLFILVAIEINLWYLRIDYLGSRGVAICNMLLLVGFALQMVFILLLDYRIGLLYLFVKGIIYVLLVNRYFEQILNREMEKRDLVLSLIVSGICIAGLMGSIALIV